jgi:UDP-glucose 4-epimerase
MKPKIVLVTGANGFIGRYVSQHLSRQGFRVIGIGHGKWSSEDEQKLWGVSDWFTSDITVDGLRICEVVPESIIHCAGNGSVGLSIQNPFDDFERNLDTTINVLEYVRLYVPSANVITMSSAGVYGDVKKFPIVEDDLLNPISPYGVHKKLSEELCKSYADHFGLNISVLRLFSVYGPGLKKQLLWDACNKIMRGEYKFFGTGNELRDWINVTDVARMVEHLLSSSHNNYNLYNGATGLGTPIIDILKLLFTALDVNKPATFTGKARQGDPVGYIADISRARQELKWEPKIKWQQGMLEYAEWFKGHEID